jgi:hypothetical protein
MDVNFSGSKIVPSIKSTIAR